MKDEFTLMNTLKNTIKTIFFIFLAILPSSLLAIASSSAENLSTRGNWIVVISLLLIILGIIYYLFSHYLKHTNERIQKIGWKDLAIAFGLFILLRLSVVGYVYLNEYMNGNTITSNDAALQQFSATVSAFPMYLLLFNFIVAVAGPILEELAFRGIFINTWFKSPRDIKAAILTSLVFALAHGFDNLITFSMYFMMALIFYYAYYRRGNILDAILVHIFNNGLVIVASTFLNQ